MESNWWIRMDNNGRGILITALIVGAALVLSACGGAGEGEDEPIAKRVEVVPAVAPAKPDCATTWPKPNWCPA